MAFGVMTASIARISALEEWMKLPEVWPVEMIAWGRRHGPHGYTSRILEGG